MFAIGTPKTTSRASALYEQSSTAINFKDCLSTNCICFASGVMNLAFLDKVFKKEEEIDIEEFLNTMDVEEETLYEEADAFVKPMVLASEEDVQNILKEAKQGNIVLVNIEGLSRRNAIKLKELISIVKQEIARIDGDIARISQDRVLVTPSKVKIIKKKSS
jgi:hypothetical protein